MYAICLTINDPPWATHLLHCELRQSLLSLAQNTSCLSIRFLLGNKLPIVSVMQKHSTKSKSDRSRAPERRPIVSPTTFLSFSIITFATAVPSYAGCRHCQGGQQTQPGQPDQAPDYHLSGKVRTESKQQLSQDQLYKFRQQVTENLSRVQACCSVHTASLIRRRVHNDQTRPS